MIPFTRFTLPDGEKSPGSFERPDEIEVMAQALLKAGYTFELEELRNGSIHMDCTHRWEDMPAALELVPDGPEVPQAVDRLVTQAYRRWKAQSM